MISDDQFARLCAQSLAGQMLATMALDVLARLVPADERGKVLEALSKQADASFNKSSIVTGDPGLDTLVLEFAREQVQQALAAVKDKTRD